jgi:hypothetical protein
MQVLNNKENIQVEIVSQKCILQMFGKLLINVNSISKKANKKAKVVVRSLYGLEK